MRQVLVSFVALSLVSAGCSSDIFSPAGCEDASQCPTGHICSGRKCVLECSIDFDCEDGNGCTTDVCDADLGCISTDNTDACDDGNPCTDGDTCSSALCGSGAPLPDGTVCDRGASASVRDICMDTTCVPSYCGDGYVDLGADPAEECDDGGNVDGDGCEADCYILPPELSITFPERGATLTGSSDILVTGSAADPGVGLTSLTLNGETVVIDASDQFSHPMTVRHGLNVVELIATNTAGKITRRTVGFYWSAAYRDYADPVTDTPRLVDGLVMDIAQEVIDDGDHPCSDSSGTYICTEVDDIATLGEITLNNLDLASTIGSIPIAQDVTPFLAQYYSIGPVDIIDLGDPVVLTGEFGLLGDVTVTSEVIDLDFNALALALQAQSAGIDGQIEIDTVGTLPGFSMTVRTTAAVSIEAKFTDVALTYLSFNAADLICSLFLADPQYDVICADSNDDYAPIASLYPAAWADSAMAIERMLLDITFQVNTASGGGVEVTLLSGTADFLNSNLDIDPIQDMQIDLGNLDILGLSVPLGTISLSGIASNLNAVVGGLADALVNGLQPVVEVAINALLLNPSDPLAVGSLLETAINSLQVSGTLPLTPLGSAVNAPTVTVDSVIDGISLSAPVGGDLLTGGMQPQLGTLFSAEKWTTRTPLGSVLSDGCYGTPPPMLTFADTSPLEMAHHIDSINQAVFAVWWNGGFDAPIGHADVTDPPASAANFSWSLELYTPPILNNCDGADLVLQVADARVSGQFLASLSAESFEAFISAEVPVTVAVDNGEVVLLPTAGTSSWTVHEIVSTRDAAWEPELTPLLEQVLIEEVLLRYGGAIVTALPTFGIDLSALAPSGSAATLEFTPTAASDQGRFQVLDGTAGQ